MREGGLGLGSRKGNRREMGGGERKGRLVEGGEEREEKGGMGVEWT